jgi:hypothetical protein
MVSPHNRGPFPWCQRISIKQGRIAGRRRGLPAENAGAGIIGDQAAKGADFMIPTTRRRRDLELLLWPTKRGGMTGK